MGALGSVDDCHQVITNPRWRFSETLQLQLQKRLIINAFPAQNVKDSYIDDVVICKDGLVKILIIHTLKLKSYLWLSFNWLLHGDQNKLIYK